MSDRLHKIEIRQWLRMFFSLLALILLSTITQAQMSFSVGYSYLFNRELDKVFQLYNSSRPWQNSTLYPLTHGIDLNFGWNIKLQESRQIHVLPQLGYGHSRTSVVREGDRLATGIQRAEASCMIRFHPRAVIGKVYNAGPMGTRWFMTLTPGYSFVWSYLRDEGEQVKYRDEVYRPKTFVFFASAGVGHHLLMLKQRIIITPELSVSWYPLIDIRRYPAMVNGHNSIGLKDTFNDVLLFQFRIRATLMKKEINWWDVPTREN